MTPPSITRTRIMEAVPTAVRFNPDARQYLAYRLSDTRLLGTLAAETLDAACAEATERWPWDRGDRLGIREIGQEDSKHWPFEKQPVDRLHIYAVRRSAPIAWKPVNHGSRTEPVYRFKLDAICAVDLHSIQRAESLNKGRGVGNGAPDNQ